MIIRNAHKMMELLDNSPHDFILNHQEKDLKSLEGFVHRTFNYIDFQQFIKSLKHIYLAAWRIRDGTFYTRPNENISNGY